MYQLKKSPVPSFIKHITPEQMLELLFLLEESSSSEFVKRELCNILKLQLPDGGFPFKTKSLEKLSSARRTSEVLTCLKKWGLTLEEEAVRKAVDFLFTLQRDDGGWSENPKADLPERYFMVSTQHSVTWLTSDILDVLIELEMKNDERVEKGIAFLISSQLSDGHWEPFEGSGVDIESSARIVFRLKRWHRGHLNSIEKGLRNYERDLEKQFEDIKEGKASTYDFFILLGEEQIKSGYGTEDRRVKEMVKALIQAQDDDGGWSDYSHGQKYWLTYDVVQILLWLDILSKRDIRKEIREYLKRIN